MANTYNYLNLVFQKLKSESKQNPLLISLVLVLLSIPLGYAINGFAVGLFVLITIITFKKSNFRIDKNGIIPIFLYFLMVLSIIWSQDVNATVKAISKTL